MTNYRRIPGGEKTPKTGTKWTKDELWKVLELYLKPEGKKIHENNPAIQELANSLQRSVRSTEAQFLMYRNLDLGGDYSRGNMNKLCKELWEEIMVEREREEPKQDESRLFPNAFFSWSGSSDGAVKRPFETEEKRLIDPIFTKVTERLFAWIENVVSGSECPRSIFLVGGPGNGKTDAVEGTIIRLGELLGCQEEIESHFKNEYLKFLHKGVLPRKASLKMRIGNFEGLHLVQDATVCDPQFAGKTAQELLLDDLEQIVLNKHSNEIYLCCVNRGVLAEALPIAVNGNYRDNTIDFLNQVSVAVSPHPDSICAWPLGEYPNTAIWPMDIESLVDPAIYDSIGTPGEHILDYVVNPENWKDHSNCPSRKYCPFYSNQKLLANKNLRGTLLELLQSYEFVSGKRWNFRELFGLISAIMVGSEADYTGLTPCEWVDEQVQICLNSGDKNQAYRAAFRLVSKLYMHTLFPRWPKLGGVRNKFTRMLKPSGSTFDGYREIVQGFLSSLFMRVPDNSTTISTMLNGPFGEALDPIGYSGDRYVDKDKTLSVNEVEELFSHSISLGVKSIYQYLVGPEPLLFEFLRQGELFLVQSESSSKQNVSIIKEINSTMKIFSIRLFKRSIGVRYGIYQNCEELSLYRQTLHNTKEMIKLKRVFEKLINRDSLFQASLITTFGQPEPSLARNALLKCPSIPVKSQPAGNREGVPVRSIHYLKVGGNFIPITFGLYFALYHANDGLSPSSLPEEIFALLDSTKSYALGEIVRNSETIDQYSIILGNLKEVIKYDDLGGFYVE